MSTFSFVGRPAPDFNLKAVISAKIVNEYTLSQFKGNKYVVLLFYPMNFTFVCPTELHSFQENLAEFEKRDVQILACSTETEFSHVVWMGMPREKGGIKGVTFPVLSDSNRSMTESYGMMRAEYYYEQNGEVKPGGSQAASRGLFLIDKEGIVRYQVVNEVSIGRSVHETLRIIDALKAFEETGDICPANWKKGQKTVPQTPQALGSYLSQAKTPPPFDGLD